jgi:hypothetical protein
MKVRSGQNVSDALPVQNGLKQRYAVWPFLFNFTLEYTIRKVQENQDEMEQRVTSRQTLGLCSQYFNKLGENTKLSARFTSRCQNAAQNHNLLTANKVSQNVAKFKDLGMTATNKICIPNDIKSRLNSRNACYCSVQNTLSSCLLSKILK